MNVLLAFHIIGALFTVGLVIATVVKIAFRGNTKKLRHGLVVNGVWQMLTGAGLVFGSNGAIAPYCLTGVLYLAVIVTTLAAAKKADAQVVR